MEAINNSFKTIRLKINLLLVKNSSKRLLSSLKFDVEYNKEHFIELVWSNYIPKNPSSSSRCPRMLAKLALTRIPPCKTVFPREIMEMSNRIAWIGKCWMQYRAFTVISVPDQPAGYPQSAAKVSHHARLQTPLLLQTCRSGEEK